MHLAIRIRNERIKLNILQAVPFWIASLLTGLVAVLFTRLFGMAENATSFLFLHESWLFFIISPLCFATGWWVVKKYAPFARGSGIPQTIAAIELANPKQHHK